MISYNEDPYNTVMQHTVVQQVQGTRKVLLNYRQDYTTPGNDRDRAIAEFGETFETPQVARLLYEFARSDLGAKVLQLGANIAIKKFEDLARMSTEYRVVGTFTDEQLTKYEQWAMLQRLAGNLDDKDNES
jgi:hypothetical protein